MVTQNTAELLTIGGKRRSIEDLYEIQSPQIPVSYPVYDFEIEGQPVVCSKLGVRFEGCHYFDAERNGWLSSYVTHIFSESYQGVVQINTSLIWVTGGRLSETNFVRSSSFIKNGNR